MKALSTGLMVVAIGGLACDVKTPSGVATGVEAIAQSRIDETDAPVPLRLVERAEDGHYHTIATGVRTAVPDGDSLLVVDEDQALFRLQGTKKIYIATDVSGEPTVLPDGSIVVSRSQGEPGETDLWIYPKNGLPAPLAPAPGGDDMPIALPDGRVAFVSTRTTVASWWVVDPRVGEPVQLTNHGQVAGQLTAAVTTTPAERAVLIGGRLQWDDGEGGRFELDPRTGSVEARR